MNTVQVLGVLTATEIIACHNDFQGVTIILWVFYGLYKILQL